MPGDDRVIEVGIHGDGVVLVIAPHGIGRRHLVDGGLARGDGQVVRLIENNEGLL